MADYPYRMTLVMPTTALVAGADNVAFAAWLNAAQPGTVPDDLGPPVSFTGGGNASHSWASSASTETGMRQTLDYLSPLAGLAAPGDSGWWDTATLQEKLDFANLTLQPSLSITTNGGVRLEDAAGETHPEQLLAEMTLSPLQHLLPEHPSKNLAWRVRADLGVNTDPEGLGAPASADGDPARYWEDLGAARVSAFEDDPSLVPVWYSDRISGQPAVSAPGSGSEALMLSTQLNHGIGTGPFSFYAVVRFASFTDTDYQIIWSGYSGADLRVEIGAVPGAGIGYVHFEINYLDGATSQVASLDFYAHELLEGTWYYLLLTRRPSDSMLRVWVNTLYVPELPEYEAGQFMPYEIPNGNQNLFASQRPGYHYPMAGEIAEAGLFAECLETSGAKIDLDTYIGDRYGL